MSPRHVGHADRFGGIVAFLQVCAGTAFVLALVGTVAPGAGVGQIGDALVVLFVAVPVIRVTWLVIRWVGRGDRRFAVAGCCLLAVVAATVAIAFG